METIQYQIASFIEEVFYKKPIYSISRNGDEPRAKKRIPLVFGQLYATIILRKIDVTLWFRLAINAHLALLIILAVTFNIPGTLMPLFQITCVLSGWVYFNSFMQAIRYMMWNWLMPKNKLRVENQGLFIPGSQIFSRIIILSLLITSLFLASMMHPGYLILTSLIGRWLLECQLRAFIEVINLKKGITQKKIEVQCPFVKKY